MIKGSTKFSDIGVAIKHYTFVDANGCWIWTGSKKNGVSYGRIKWKGKTHRAHRLSYEFFNGELDPTLTIDHICGNPPCVNPKHLEQINIRDNILRGSGVASVNFNKTHCTRGHEFSLYNTKRYSVNTSHRVCLTCKRIRDRQTKDRKKLSNSIWEGAHNVTE